MVNARDAMPDGGTIAISARTGDASNVKAPSGSFVCVSVTDTGHGMDEAKATSEEQALRILRRSVAVDLLITDHMMPGIRGTAAY